MVTTYYPPYNFGGDGIFVQRLAHALAEHGHTVDVIHCVDAYRLTAGQEPARTYEHHSNITVHGLRSSFGRLSPLATQQTGHPYFKTAALRRVLDRQFDVIHYHNISLVGGPKVLMYGRGIKLYTMHEYWLICPTHVLFKFNREVCHQPQCVRCTLSYGRPPQLWRASNLLKTAIQQVDAFLALSQSSLKRHQQAGFAGRLIHCPGFVPPVEVYNEKTFPTPKPQPYFLVVGRLEKLKGIQTLIPLFHSNSKARLLIAGTGKYEPELRRLAAGNPRIQFLGYVSGTALYALYRHAHAVLVPSLCPEIFPLVILEAFQQQTPVIARALGGMSELIHESAGGLLYETNAELLSALELLHENETYRRTLGEQGYQAYLQQWTVETHLQRYFTLIDEIVAARRQSGCGTGAMRN